MPEDVGLATAVESGDTGDGRFVQRRGLILLLGVLTAFAPLTMDIYLPAMPTLARVFATSAAQVQFTLSTYFVGFALGQAFFGPISDRWGRKPPLYAGMALYIAASVACTLAPTIHAVALLRFVQAIGACAGAVVARAIVSDLFHAREAARIFAVLTMVMGVAPVAAPVVGAWLMGWFGWAAIFWLLAAFGLACLIASWARLPETHPPGAGAPPPALGEVLARYGRLAVDPGFLGYCLPGAFSLGGMFAYIVAASFVFIGVHHFAPAQFALLFGLNACGLVAAAQINRVLLRRHEARALLRAGILVQAVAALALLGAALAGRGGALAIAAPLFLYIATIGFVFPNATALAMAGQRAQAGLASALIGVIQSGFGAVTAIIVGALHNATAVPMALVIAVYALVGLALVRVLMR
jgi:MFS transporter, DHA1 family, multidrug resistance protein